MGRVEVRGWCSREEKEKIKKKAVSSRMSLGQFVVKCCLEKKIKNIVDNDA